MHRSKEREGATSPGPTYMSQKQMSSYLQDLRSNRPARPTGSRPPPAHFNNRSNRNSVKFADSPAPSPSSVATFEEAGVDTDTASRPPSAAEARSHRRTTSNMSIDEVITTAGRPLVQPPRGRDIFRKATARERTPSVQYRESGRRQVERDEARSIRMQMEELELKSEQGLYDAARDEAAELVWKHRNPNAPGASENAPYAYPGLARKEDTQRSRSVGPSQEEQDTDLQRRNSKLRKRNSMGSSPGGSRSSSLQSQRIPSGSSVSGNAAFASSPSPTKDRFDTTGSGGSAVLPKNASKSSDIGHRRRSSGSKRKTSASLFKNPEDQIYEEPEEENFTPAPAPVAKVPSSTKAPLNTRRNPFSRVQVARENYLTRANTDPTMATRRFDRYEIHNNPPTQSRNAGYTRNFAVPSKPAPKDDAKSDAENEPEVKMKDGKEIRGDDIRAATGFKLKDRSAKLPTPTLVSDSPGRPIVSFTQEYPKEIELKEEISLSNATPRPLSQASGPRPLSKSSTEPIVPTIHDVKESASTAPEPGKITPPTSSHSVKASPVRNSPFRRKESANPSTNVHEDPPAPARPLPSVTRKVNTPPQTATAPVPTINVSQTPAARSRPAPAPDVPSIAVQEKTPSPAFNALQNRFGNVNAPSRTGSPAAAPAVAAAAAGNEAPPSVRPGSRGTFSLRSSAQGEANGSRPGSRGSPPVPSISFSETPVRPSSRGNPPIPSIAVSETPARPSSRGNPPIPTIAFNEASARPSSRGNPPIPSIAVNETPSIRPGSRGTPPVPTIAVNDAPSARPSSRGNPPIPSIAVNDNSSRPASRGGAPSISVTPSVPSINVNGSSTGSTRPLPDPKNHSSRPFARNGTTSTTTSSSTSRNHFTPTTVRTGALCSQCALPIAGRIVSAGGARFHPECFLCHHCGEHLECVAFYPEPTAQHASRVSRIRARARGEDLPFLDSHPTPQAMAQLEADDGHDETLRFYCHLDFHEMFSPRCKSCKTPIEGEVVVACGAEWHVGHFFCAQCGDPFDSSTPFVEKEGYAWCVGCHTHRYSTKCKKCRKPVVDTVVKALGAEWHMECFCCMVVVPPLCYLPPFTSFFLNLRCFFREQAILERFADLDVQECSGPFEDGRYFLRGETQDPVCVRCEERRLKA
ncbi:hypothetical protein BS50DRAFT_165932 [Corynespora cassiicola Philippines]|uniref:LIM zinc-binding domain-containing protein n=1 Tax=Corynespora cassiicola Philippines TaxID=1448308 RepID=A0A2T2P4Z6_CORCC|nr:hypothetical protein BS50DRAFT_165932 [Corynespora cassiicola Philippines]